ncbi:MAG: hypothetical protein B1H03_06760 [Planctomycetales bacterium 4484_113]|nr:MAG: hypothetical protein B1H03_06760 [Planctomycetales bacterium 4484_113]
MRHLHTRFQRGQTAAAAFSGATSRSSYWRTSAGLADSHFGGLSGLAAHFGWDPADAPACIVPLPLHPLKRFRRGFNQNELQNELVLQFYAPPLGLPVASGLLRRVRNTRSQVGLGASDRFRNVRNAFAVPPRMLPQVENRSVLLFDDLITTGATVNAAARALKSAGAKKVYALSLFTASLKG